MRKVIIKENKTKQNLRNEGISPRLKKGQAPAL